MKNSLYSILTNPKYQGTYMFNRLSARSIAGTRNSHLYKDDEDIIVIEGGCPQIVDKETYSKVQERITENKTRGGRGNAKIQYLLSGKLYCKECGKALVGNNRRSGRSKLVYTTYRCPTKRFCCSNKEINKGYLETKVVSLLEKHIFNSTSMKRIAKQIDKYTENIEYYVEDTSDSKQELEEVMIALKNVADAVASGLISDSLIQKLNELEAKKALLEKDLAYTENITKDVSIDTSLILSEYRTLKDTPSLPEYKTFVAGFIDKIVVGKYSVDITLKTGLDIVPDLNTTYTVSRQEIYNQK